MKVVVNSMPPYDTSTCTLYIYLNIIQAWNVYIQCNEYYSMLEISLYSNLLLEGMPYSIMYAQTSMWKRSTLVSWYSVHYMHYISGKLPEVLICLLSVRLPWQAARCPCTPALSLWTLYPPAPWPTGTDPVMEDGIVTIILYTRALQSTYPTHSICTKLVCETSRLKSFGRLYSTTTIKAQCLVCWRPVPVILGQLCTCVKSTCMAQ